MKRVIRFLPVATAVLALAGCTSAPTARAPGGGKIEEATVQSVKPVVISGQVSLAGRITGAAASAVTLGIGGIAVEEADKRMNQKAGQELLVRTDKGETFVVVQATPPEFVEGDRVRIIRNGSAITVEYLWDAAEVPEPTRHFADTRRPTR